MYIYFTKRNYVENNLMEDENGEIKIIEKD